MTTLLRWVALLGVAVALPSAWAGLPTALRQAPAPRPSGNPNPAQAPLSSSVPSTKKTLAVVEAKPAQVTARPHKPWFDHFRLNGIVARQDQGGGLVLSGEGGWNPTFGKSIYVSADLGASYFKRDERFGGGFLVGTGQLMAGIVFDEIYAIELGGGIQDWFGAGGFFPIASANFVFGFASPIAQVTGVFVGYSHLFSQDLAYEAARAGIKVSF